MRSCSYEVPLRADPLGVPCYLLIWGSLGVYMALGEAERHFGTHQVKCSREGRGYTPPEAMGMWSRDKMPNSRGRRGPQLLARGSEGC